MTKPPKKKQKQEESDERIPFDDALRMILKSPPKHKTAKKGKAGKKL